MTLWVRFGSTWRVRLTVRAAVAVTLVLGLLVAGCQAGATTSTGAGTGTAAPASATAVASPAAARSASAGSILEIAPLPPDETAGPVRLQIPAIDLDVPVIAMGWRLGMVDNQRTTVWDVPLEEAGWHINSTGTGGAGNMVISGRQADGAAVFAPLALGAVAPDQEIFVTDGDGITFVYRITEVTPPIPVTGATPEEQAQAAAYFAPTDTARLTLATGWPEFTTTHRIFALADFVGVQE